VRQRLAWLAVILVCASPLVALVAKSVTHLSGELVLHLGRTVLPMQLGYSLLVAVGATLGAAALAAGGLGCALFDFRGRRLLEKLLLVPLLLPAWFLAVLYHDVWRVEGVGALILTLAIATAPLFHLLGTAALRRVPRRYPEMLRVLGFGAPSSLLRLVLPLAVPALAAVAALLFLLALADAASASTLGVPTLTVGLLDQWFGREDDAAGALISLVLLATSLLPGLLLWRVLARAAWQDSARLGSRPSERLTLTGWRGLTPWALSAAQLVAGVLLPCGILATWVVERLYRVDLALAWADALRTLLLAAGGTAGALALALPLLHAQIATRSRRVAAMTGGITVAVFALPPMVLGLTLLWMLPSGRTPGVAEWLNATPLPLVLALGLHFTGVVVAAGRAGLLREARSHGALLAVLGRSGMISSLRLLRPYLAGPLAAATAFVFLEAEKELALPLVLRPFGFETITSRLFQYAQTQRVHDCAVWVLLLALIGVYPLFTLARLVADERPGGA
jgi:iron(III) transport system permease protein